MVLGVQGLGFRGSGFSVSEFGVEARSLVVEVRGLVFFRVYLKP